MNNNYEKWKISDEEKSRYIQILTDELPLLRARAGIPQDELAGIIGYTRQTYSAIERRVHPMSWSIYLALVFFFDNIAATHNELRNIGAYPNDILERMNNYESTDNIILGQAMSEAPEVLEKLDDQAMYAIRAVIMAEFARCTELPIEAVVKSFSGKVFGKPSEKDLAVRGALGKIRGNKNK